MDRSFYIEAQNWNILLNCLPKLIQYFGNTEHTFYSLVNFLECKPDFICKLRVMARRYIQTPFAHLLYVLYETAPTIDIFTLTIFEWTQKRGLLEDWINHIIMDRSYPKIFLQYVDLYITNKNVVI